MFVCLFPPLSSKLFSLQSPDVECWSPWLLTVISALLLLCCLLRLLPPANVAQFAEGGGGGGVVKVGKTIVPTSSDPRLTHSQLNGL